MILQFYEGAKIKIKPCYGLIMPNPIKHKGRKEINSKNTKN